MNAGKTSLDPKTRPDPMVEGDASANRVRRKVATISDVAETAGVAIGTVSRFLNGRALRRGNREQIEAAIAKLSYRRNAVATAMKTDRTHMVGLLIPAFDEFHATMVERLAELVRTRGRALVMYCHGHDPRVMGEALDFFAAQRSDALITDGLPDVRHRVEELIRQGTPIILYNNDIPSLAADSVMVENRSASARAVGHLLALGHERIGIVTGDLTDSSGQQRLDGYRQALGEHGIAPPPAYIVRGTWEIDSGYEAARHLMHIDRPPTAVFVSNYRMTIGILNWMKDHGLRAPDDLSVVSFDDIALFRLHEPGITAVAQPIAGIAEAIAGLLDTRLASVPARTPRHVVLDCDVILRGSTGRPVQLGTPQT